MFYISYEMFHNFYKEKKPEMGKRWGNDQAVKESNFLNWTSYITFSIYYNLLQFNTIQFITDLLCDIFLYWEFEQHPIFFKKRHALFIMPV